MIRLPFLLITVTDEVTWLTSRKIPHFVHRFSIMIRSSMGNSVLFGSLPARRVLTHVWVRTRLAGRLPKRRSEEHTSELQSHSDLVCRLLLDKTKTKPRHL